MLLLGRSRGTALHTGDPAVRRIKFLQQDRHRLIRAQIATKKDIECRKPVFGPCVDLFMRFLEQKNAGHTTCIAKAVKDFLQHRGPNALFRCAQRLRKARYIIKGFRSFHVDQHVNPGASFVAHP